MFRRPGNYFLKIRFKNEEMLRALGISEASEVDIGTSKYPAVFTPDDETSFEYFIMPKSIRNGRYSYSAIFDQQNKIFLDDSSEVEYWDVLTFSNKNAHLWCRLNTFHDSGIAAFSACFVDKVSDASKSLTFYFENRYLNLANAHRTWGERAPIVRAIEGTAKDTREVQEFKDILWVGTSLQSELADNRR